VEGLDDELQWPDAEKKQELAATYLGMFHGCIGVADVKEYQVVKYLDPVKERRSWSGKKKINSYKLLSVMDQSGHYIFACLCLGKNDHEIFTGSPLYLQEGEFFLQDEFVAADGVFEGDGHLRCSYKNPRNDDIKKLWNLAFQEVRAGVGKRKSIVTNYCQLWITQVVTFLLAYVWERMIVKCLLEVHYIYKKANSSRKMSL